jgi:hypothetical protein
VGDLDQQVALPDIRAVAFDQCMLAILAPPTAFLAGQFYEVAGICVEWERAGQGLLAFAFRRAAVT